MAAIVFLLSPLSAFASTTESMLMYAAVEDDYGVMPLVGVNSFYFKSGAGIYNLNNDTYNITYFGGSNYSNGDEVYTSDYSGANAYNTYNSDLAFISSFYVGTPSSSSSLSIPDGSQLRLTINNIGFQVRSTSTGNGQFNLWHSDAVPFKAFCKMYFTATAQSGNTHYGTYHEQSIDISPFLSPSKVPNTNNAWWDLDCNLSVQADTSNLSDGIDRIYNVNLRYFEIFIVYNFYNFQNSTGYFLGQSGIADGLQVRTGSMFRNNTDAVSVIRLTYQPGFADSSASTVISLQNSIQNMNSSVTNSINQVKTQLTQSTNTITTKIDTMSNDIKTGLNNVISSAQQNTQNIINTVTQKVDEVKTGITEVKDSILDLPNKIQEMLLGLIVPDSDTMADKYSEFSGLLEEKLGVIYQIPMMLFDFFDTIVNAATTPQAILTLPAFTLPWIDGSTLTVWNSMEYKIIPDGLEVLSDLIKTVTSMTVVVLTFNSVKRAYERFLRS